MKTEERRNNRSTEEVITLSLQVAEHVYHRVRHGEAPIMKEIQERFDLEPDEIRRLINPLKRHFMGDFPHIYATFRNWLYSLRVGAYEQANYALLTKEMLTSPASFGTLTMREISSALSVPVQSLRKYYRRFREDDWPPLPPSDSKWLDDEAVGASIRGDTERLASMNTNEEELLAMRQELIDNRFLNFAIHMEDVQ